ncbi:dTDP-4-dehydrorhamnose reductase [Cohnella sp. GCM10012308]|uniref:dTDP-4-dehydrorhamnose reductase n=1 Tax=Cohnella sp. GCM10012308 TaxID=3317329 RepID=UPI00361A2A32
MVLKVLIAGGNGQLGRELNKLLDRKYRVMSCTSDEMDILNKNQLNKRIKAYKPDWIINCAAYNNVDEAEIDRSRAELINELGPRNLAEVANEHRCALLHFSSDYVFDGRTDKPYIETDPTNPINHYGRTKVEGEKRIMECHDDYLIIRTSWLYGGSGRSFVNAVLARAKQGSLLQVVDDQIGNPTCTLDLALQVELAMRVKLSGLYHCSGLGYCSRFDFAEKILSLAGISADVKAIKTSDTIHNAERPLFSALDSQLIEQSLGRRMLSWEDSLEAYMKKEINNGPSL